MWLPLTETSTTSPQAHQSVATCFIVFQEFNVGSGDTANFVDPGIIENILSRVTGANVSNIFGQLRPDSTANLYFLNPNGVVFGPNSSLDIGGSFHVSTADFIRLGEGSGLFSASDPASDVLIAAPPSEFGFLPGNVNAGSVEIQGLRHENSGKILEIVGGDIVIRSGTLTVPGGDILLTGDNLTVMDGAAIFSDATDNLNGGDININVSGKVLLENNSQISSTSNNTHDAGNLSFKISELETFSPTRFFDEGTSISSRNLSEEPDAGNAGNVTIEGPNSPVPGPISLTGTDITTEATSGGGGSILVDGAEKTVLDSTTVSARVTAGGQGGDITIRGSQLNPRNPNFGNEQLLGP